MIAEMILLITLIIFAGMKSYRYLRPYGFPPGPLGLPLFGSLLTFRKSPLTAMMRWKNEYGDIVGLNLGQFRAVLISDYSLLKEAFNNEQFNGRPEFKPALLFTGGEAQGTLTSDGNPWAVIRRFTIKNLNDLGFGKKSTESMIQDDVAKMVSSLAENSTAPIQLHDKFYVPVSSHLWYILVGKRILDHEFESFKNALVRLHKALWRPIGSAIWFMPWLTNIFPNWTGWRSLVETLPLIKTLVNDEIVKHKVSMDVGCNNNNEKPSDLIQAYLLAIAKTTDKVSQFYDSSGENHMRSMVLNLFVTASEAVSNTLNWTFTYLSLYPEIQKKLFEEIQQVIGSNNTPNLSDSLNMPYANAIIQEVLRIASTSPFSNFQMTTSDVNFHGYFIPKNTVVIANLYSLHHSSVWGDPEVFRPERFLTPHQAQQPPLIPFSVGLRVCLGQAFARNELFLFMVTLCQRFIFEWDPSTPIPSADDLTDQSHVSIFRFAKNYSFVLKDRLMDLRLGQVTSAA